MAKYNVELHRPATVTENATITIEADSPKEAQAKAEEIVVSGNAQEYPGFQWHEDIYLGPDDSFEVDEVRPA